MTHLVLLKKLSQVKKKKHSQELSPPYVIRPYVFCLADGSILNNADNKNPFLKKASQMLGAIPARAAFASEFPTKDAAISFHAAQPSGSVHVTAGMITISDGNMGWSYGKNENVDFILSFGLVQGNEKPANSLTRAMLMFMCLWVFLFSVSFKVSTLVSSR